MAQREITQKDILERAAAAGWHTWPGLIETGFVRLDGFLGGGLRPGLYVLGGVPGEGKTTFALQAADQIASAGTQVLYAATEQTAGDLLEKSLTRTARLMGAHIGPYGLFGTEGSKDILRHAADVYRGTAARLRVLDYTDGRLSAGKIYETAVSYDTPPVIFVDYLQDLEPDAGGGTERTAVEDAVMKLARLPRVTGMPVFVVSSFNRESYGEPVSRKSFKETGRIEYAADCLLGLQLSGMGYTDGDISRPSSRRGRVTRLREDSDRTAAGTGKTRLELVCVKNRRGPAFTMPFTFDGAGCCFSECGETQKERAEGSGRRFVL